MWLTRDVKADGFRERKIDMKRKDEVGPKIKYDEMIILYAMVDKILLTPDFGKSDVI